MRRVLFAMLVCALGAAGQSNQAAGAARQWRVLHEREILNELMGLLARPNLARDALAIRANASAVAAILEKRGVRTRLLEVEGAPPVVFGSIETPGAIRTIIFYAHYDGQPVDPKEWATPPWEPVVREGPLGDGAKQGAKIVALPATGPVNPEWRVYARSASDDKAPIVALAADLDALKAAHVPLHSNVKLVFEGEEEAGSPHLAEILRKYKDLLASDVWLICDGPVHQSRRQQIVFGARGITEIDLTVYGPAHELHSGHYGNWAPNPAMMLARLLASMKDDEGRVTIERFYDGIEPLSATERQAIAEAPDVDASLMRELWLGRTEGGGKKLVELLNLPSLNVRGMSSARTGAGASNVIPASATATIDIRLVKGITVQDAAERVLAHIRAQGYFVTESEPDAAVHMAHPKVARVTVAPGGYNASRTSMDLPISKLVLRTAEDAVGPVVKLPTMGGSVPLFMIEDILGAPTITTPIVNHDNNQHAMGDRTHRRAGRIMTTPSRACR